MIAILGQPLDTAPYASREGYIVPPPYGTPEQVRAWITERVAAGDEFELVSTDFTERYGNEIRWLQNESYKLHMQARPILDRAREIDKAVADVAKLARAEQDGRDLTSVV